MHNLASSVFYSRLRVASTALSILALAGVVAACGDGSTHSLGKGGAGGADGSTGVGGAGNGGANGVYDAFVGPDFRTGRGDATTGGKGFQEPCTDNLDCISGWCVPYQDHNVCSERCLDEGCPDGWSCHAVANTDPDVVFICFPPGNRLCGQCLGDADCPGGRCFELDGQNVCGLDCQADETCPPDYACKAVLEDAAAPKQCVPKTESCTCNKAHDHNDRVCERTNGLGTCFGHQLCDGAAGWTPCSAPDAVPEVCNQVDDDCNGLTDDIPNLGGPCERTVDLGGQNASCAGRLICTRDTEEPVCTAQEPKAEACNYLDDDCDGDTDEDFPEVGSICEVGVGACHRVGVVECEDDGSGTRCNVVEGQPAAELCNGLDDNCDGRVDEGFDGLNEPCFNGMGGCRRAAALRCAADGHGVECPAVPGDPGEELCDGIDNNCDGTVDEGFDGLFEPCDAGAGGCRRTGFLYCTEDGRRVECTAVPTAPVPEACNGIDDDCNGVVDESFPLLGTPCSLGQGLCQHAGVNICSPDGSGTFCNAPQSDPQDERCDGLDNDCDGSVDEDFPNLDTVCSVGIGACLRVGIVSCAADGSAAACSAVPGVPQPETCDGLDNDCNGQVDEAFPELNDSCNVGEGACLRYGVLRCAADGSSSECTAVAGQPADEICDGIDNNCDGQVDEGFDGIDEPCAAGVGTCAHAGVGVCADDGGSVICNAVAGAPAPERCNGLDDNCDGHVDEALGDLLQPCEAGAGECHRVGVRVCAPDGSRTQCTVSAAPPSAELCDSRDNDCDGQVDEDFPTVSTPCAAGVGECARPGVNVCSADGRGVVCNAVAAAPSAELCDGRDNNCDGHVDEGFVGIGSLCDVGVGLCARSGVLVCAGDGSAVICNVDAGDPTDEICDNLDDDCDGQTDEGFDGLGAPCSVGLGACVRSGVGTCADDGGSVVCSAHAGAPAARELCNGIDDTCDGRTDEGFVGVGTVCNVGAGACARSGVNVCSADGQSVACNVQAGQPTPERCDAVDNNCDGRTDEGFAGLGTPCSAGQGVCQRAGVNVCSADGSGVSCNAVASAPAPAELCNGLDDDCNGRVDESFADLNTACSVGVGACFRNGVRVCAANGAGTLCNAVAGNPVAEICDGVDNNCDGHTDEATASLGQICSVGRGACRRAGIYICNPNDRGGAAICDVSPGQPSAEQCNGVDDDCDGSTDEDFPTVGVVCNVGVGGCARAGVNVCSADGTGVACNAAPGAPSVERCDSVDNDCDGLTDEIFPTLGTPCSAGRGICQRAGVNVCSGDGLGVSCNAVPGAALPAEVCNGLDDNCDGSVDESFPTLGTPCSAGRGICQRAGVNVCAVGGAGVSCNAVAGAAAPAELCNGLDDNCDGRTDEAFADLNTACSVGTGACLRNGVKNCSGDGLSTTCNAVAGLASADVCDGVDNNCEGHVDENNANLGQVCTAGQGICRRSGVFVCNAANRAGAAICDAVAGNPPDPVEDCDYQDDNCNGTTDEGYTDAQGRYVTLANCGACGNNCNSLWNNNPMSFGVAPSCGVVANVAQCTYACLPGYLDADRVPNNGCELQIDAGAVYVSTPANGGLDGANCGTVQAPCATIGTGITRAQAQAKTRVLVSDGVYTESVTLVAGISVLGGHHRTTWARDWRLNVTIINGKTLAGVHKRTVTAIGINVGTTLDGFVINGENALTDGNSYGVYIRDCNNQLHVTNNRIFAGNGGRGSSGASGASGTNGGAGSTGKTSFNNVISPLGAGNPVCSPDPGAAAIVYTGGAGGVQTCGAVSATGGTGGGSKCPRRERQEGSGVAGLTAPRGGAGGAGAWGMDGTRSGGNATCTVSNGGPADASNGVAGVNGGDAAGGGGAPVGNGTVAANEWAGVAGGGGTAAVSGGGGGGGGAAAGVRETTALVPANWDIGATGGGGGAGGCQGVSGAGGNAGGGSFGIFVTFTGAGPLNAAGIPDLSFNDIYRGLGGDGGDGGNGGVGGDGGVGGAGGAVGAVAALNYAFCSFQGGTGGKGGRGGHGAGGGGGLGGASYEIFVNNENAQAPNFAITNTFGVAAGTVTGGAGGEGGGSLNVVTGLGSAGGRGNSGNLLRVP